jgi:transposase InsO family protein
MDGLGKDRVKLYLSDSGSEFLNISVQYHLKELKVEHRTVEVGDHKALGIIDRLSRTMKEMIFKDFTERNSVVWYDRLSSYADAYNSSPHRGILNLAPDEAGYHELELVSHNLEKSIPPENPFKEVKETNIQEGIQTAVR